MKGKLGSHWAKGYWVLLLFVVCTILVTACGKDSSPATSKNDGASNEPVKLLMFNGAANFNDDEFNEFILKPVQTKYPNISIELQKGQIEDFVSAGTAPDLVATSNPTVNPYLELGLGEDMNPMLKKYNIDLSRFVPETLNGLKEFGKNGELYGIPFDMNYGLMIYNKDIFDKFAVPYPTDGMTWDQVLDLAKKLTRMDGGVQYIGADPGNAQSLTRQYSLSGVDSQQKNAALTSEGYKRVFTMMRQFYDIPGFIGPNKEFNYGNNAFYKDKRLAMQPAWINGTSNQLDAMQKSGDSLNWDIVSYPAYADRPGLGKQVDFHLFMVNPAGKHKDAVYQALQVLVSDQAQLTMNKGSNRMSVLKNPEVQKTFTADFDTYNGKNLQGIFKVKPAPAPVNTIYDNKIYAILNAAQKTLAQDNTDVNSLLRQANEDANKAIEEINSGQK